MSVVCVPKIRYDFDLLGSPGLGSIINVILKACSSVSEKLTLLEVRHVTKNFPVGQVQIGPWEGRKGQPPPYWE